MFSKQTRSLTSKQATPKYTTVPAMTPRLVKLSMSLSTHVHGVYEMC